MQAVVGQERRVAARRDAVRLQQFKRQLACAAAFAANGDPFAFELREACDAGAAIEHHHRVIKHAAERHQRGHGKAIGDAALHQRDIHMLFGVQQALQVLQRTVRFQHL